MSDWARFYVTNRRWRVIPVNVLVNGVCSCSRGETCAAPGKHPAISDWTNRAFSTEQEVERWWSSHPHHNVGVVTGEASGIVVIDVDPRNGGFESLDQLEQVLPGGPLPVTLTAETGGGGRHYFFKCDRPITKGPLSADFPGIDVQANGAQVVVPPSRHSSGRRYAWADGQRGNEELAPVPVGLLALLEARGSGGGGSGGRKVDLDAVIAQGKVPEGTRNDTVYAFACRQARRSGVGRPGGDKPENVNEVIAGVTGFNVTFCSPPLGKDELMVIINSALDFVKSNPDLSAQPELHAWLESQAAAADARETADGSDDDAGGELDDDDDDGSGGPPDPDSLGPAGTPGNRSLTDNGNARRLIDYFGEDIRYSPGPGWYAWEGGVWRFDERDIRVTRLARRLALKITEEIPSVSTANQAGILPHANRTASLGAMKRAVDLAKTDERIYVAPQAWDADYNLLAVANGVVDLRTGEMYPSSREQLITRRTNVEYYPGRKDVRFEAFLDDITGDDKEFQRWLQRAVGYTLTGETKEEKFFMIYGPPGTGKSTVAEMIGNLLGEYRLSMSADTIMGGKRQDSADMYFMAEILGKRMISVAELPHAEQMKEAMIKRLTGQDMLQGRRVAEQPFNFMSRAKLWVATNHRPIIKDPGIWRRMQAIPFTQVPERLDVALKPYLLDKGRGLPGVLAWAVEGAKWWYEHGIGTCAAVETATEAYREAEDRMGMFLGEMAIAELGRSVGLRELHTTFNGWLMERSEREVTRIAFQGMLEEKGIAVEGNGARGVVHGYSLAPIAAPTSGTNWGAALGASSPRNF